MTRHSSLPGFRDFFPEEMARRNQIFRAWRDVARRYGFDEYDGPPLESLELFVAKSGPEIVNQLFNFTDKGGREVALRPEMTPTLVRMLGSKIKGLPRPVRWFSTPQLFRYEKQQRGRLREHFQLNMDIVGEDSVLADADLLAAALNVLTDLGLESGDVIARYSDRRLLQFALLDLGVREEDLPVAYNVIDKVDREPREVGLKRLVDLGMTADQAAKAFSLTEVRDLHELARRFPDNPAMEKVVDELTTYESTLRALGYFDFIAFDMKIVRGLAYYTGIVFEIFDRKGELRAICGGGRYDRLFSALAGVDIPALGFGFGDVVLGELLKEKGLAAGGGRAVDAFVIADGARAESVAAAVAFLRTAGRSVVFDYRQSSNINLGKSLKSAVAAGARHAIILGTSESEPAGLSVKVRDLEAATQEEMLLSAYLQKYPIIAMGR
ncbi:MAG TPA: histidine--tRNA ligase [Thermoanaerobaculia bacterium]|nr:histidine--tRNA ligase [Thermoanaerobaculia bacterium]